MTPSPTEEARKKIDIAAPVDAMIAGRSPQQARADLEDYDRLRAALQTPAVDAGVLAKVREALEFYADNDGEGYDVSSGMLDPYTSCVMRGKVILDGGDKAKEALRLLSTVQATCKEDLQVQAAESASKTGGG